MVRYQHTLVGHRLCRNCTTMSLTYLNVFLMLQCGVVFSEVISLIIGAWLPKHIKLLLCLAIAQPIISHIPQFRSFFMDVVVDKARGCGVICFQRSYWLWVSFFSGHFKWVLPWFHCEICLLPLPLWTRRPHGRDFYVPPVLPHSIWVFFTFG